MNVRIDKGMTRTIDIDGVPVLFRADASVPRLYRIKFRRDLFKDMAKLAQAFERKNPESTENHADESGIKTDLEEILDMDMDVELFENVAYIMAYHADREHTPDTIDEWLSQFSTLSIYNILPQILELWGFNAETTSEAKKKTDQSTGT